MLEPGSRLNLGPERNPMQAEGMTLEFHDALGYKTNPPFPADPACLFARGVRRQLLTVYVLFDMIP
jgi:hypothetical protein